MKALPILLLAICICCTLSEKKEVTIEEFSIIDVPQIEQDYVFSTFDKVDTNLSGDPFAKSKIKVDLQAIDEKSFYLTINNNSTDTLTLSPKNAIYILKDTVSNDEKISEIFVRKYNSSHFRPLFYEINFPSSPILLPKSVVKFKINCGNFIYKNRVLGIFFQKNNYPYWGGQLKIENWTLFK
ncbi:hypothetical protein [Siphonobacter sp. SORGH_AS_0500]|uniref:hypothetical protein n=1 Tax=Siphonobacter sp. SORGH_AS_0500 TaxID=1864824 RepID=UPI00285D9981|nr:hypothetical protein [Siphonobacter sp. SORGH_AS_0500]MDR6195470.1 hypothetical protein [Siphonobacter sp. SORGH_AS_0500]